MLWSLTRTNLLSILVTAALSFLSPLPLPLPSLPPLISPLSPTCISPCRPPYPSRPDWPPSWAWSAPNCEPPSQRLDSTSHSYQLFLLSLSLLYLCFQSKRRRGGWRGGEGGREGRGERYLCQMLTRGRC